MDIETDTETVARPNLEHPHMGNYRLERELGRGFSAIVYEATDERRQRTVALKVLTFLQTLSEDRRVDLAARFRREAQAVSALSHPNIVAIYEVSQADDAQQYIAMECLPGETLRQRLHRASPISIPEAVAIAVRIADALHYAHGRCIIHRDIKPDNIFLAQGSKNESTPKLMDFGIAHVLSDQGLTQDGTIVGSPAYMSPEQINGQPLDARTDIFSLAVMLTEMVTGTKPFEGGTIPAVMQQILRHTPDLRAVPDRRLSRVLAKALSKSPGARYADAAAFADALRQAAPLAAAAPSVSTQILARIPPRPAAIQSRRRARWVAVSLGGLALATLAALPLVAKRPSTAANSVPTVSQVALRPGAQRQRIAAVWHTAARHSVRVAHTEHKASHRVIDTVDTSRTDALPNSGMVRIAEVTPVHPHFPYYAHPAQISSVTQTPKPLFKPNSPALAVSARPIVRVSGRHQELNSAGKAAPVAFAETEPAPKLDALPTPPPAPRLADAPPHLVHSPMPVADAALDSPNAVVRLRLSVDENGDVTEATIITSSGSRELDDAALDAVGHWEYHPAIKNGQSVSSSVTETVKFFRG